MRYTFGQAKRSLARFADAYGLADVGEAINIAVDELANTANWQRMKRVVRMNAAGPYLALPQDCDTIVRAAIDGRPVSIKGTDYEFLQGGPGDLDYVPDGYAPLHGIHDLGYYASMFDPPEAMPVAAFSVSETDGKLRVRGRLDSGDTAGAEIAVNIWTDVGEMPAEPSVSAVSFASIDSVVLPTGAAAYISLYGYLDGEWHFLSRMHPGIQVPEFRRYRIPGFSDEDDKTYRVLAEVRARFLPMVDDRDAVPFDSLLPVQYMLQSMRAASIGEKRDAEEFRVMAERGLVVRENTQNERQGFVVINTQYSGSPGEASETEYDNI